MAIVVLINGLVGRTPLNSSTQRNILWFPNISGKNSNIYFIKKICGSPKHIYFVPFQFRRNVCKLSSLKD